MKGKMSTKTKHDFVGNRDFLDISDLDKTCLREILNVAKQLKAELKKGGNKKGNGKGR